MSDRETKMMKIVLDGCDISFVAEAPEDMTLKQLIKQSDRIIPDYCACGICSAERKGLEDYDTEIVFDYDDVKKVDEDVACRIKEINDTNNIKEQPHKQWIIKERPYDSPAWICPECGAIDDDVGLPHYCRKCGEKLDYSEEE